MPFIEMKERGNKLLLGIIATGVLLVSLLFCNSCRLHQLNNSNYQLLELPNGGCEGVLIQHSAYTLSYNISNLTANWVAYELTSNETDGPWSRKGLHFFSDPYYNGKQADNEDYHNSGYSRGHMAPAADMKWDSLAMVESFYFTNCIPQVAALNNGKWNQLEEKTRRLARQYGKVYVVCGPVYQSSDTLKIGRNGVAVPDACFKALLIQKDKDYSAIAFVMQNGEEKRLLNECACTIDELEQILSIDLFYNLPDKQEKAIESIIVWDDWDFNKK